MEAPDQILQAIFDQAAVGIAQISLDGKWLRVNKRYCQMLGYAESELRTKTLKEITHPDDRAEVLDTRRQLLEGTISSHTLEKRYIRRDGTVFWGRLNRSLVRDQYNQPQFFVAVVEDITERLQAERALRDAEQRLTLAQDAAHLGVWDSDLRTNVITIRGKYAPIHGLPPDRTTITREEWIGLIHPDDLERVQALRREAREQTHTFDAEFRIIWPDGSVRWVRAKGTVLADDSNRPIRSMGVIEDVTQRKQAEAKLRENEKRLRDNEIRLKDAQRLAKVGSWTRDLNTDKISWSDEIFRIFGVQDNALSDRQSFLSRVHPEDLPLILEAGEKIRSSVVPVDVEYRIVRPDGEIRYVRSIAEAIRNDQGVAIRTVGATQDITENVKAREVLRESEERFRNMADAAPVMIWVSGPDKLCTFFNRQWLDFRGRTLEQELGRGCVEGIHPDDRDDSLAIYNSAFDSRRPFSKMCRLRRADGEYRWILDNGIPLYRSGEFAGFIGSCVDITDQKLVEDRLRTSAAHLLSAQRLAKIGSWERNDITGKIEFSDEMLRILGMPEHPPRTMAEFLHYVHSEDRESVSESVLRARSTGVSIAGEYRMVRADGEARFVRSVVEAIRNERGEVIRVGGVTQDITDLKRGQEESAARQKLESVGALANGIAHDFNNLLGGVLAQADVALGQLAAGSSPEEELKVIRNVALRGSEIVHQLMTYAGTESEALVPVDVTLIVKEMVELLKLSMSKHATLEIDLGQDLPAIEASPAQIRQIVMNLVTNASEALGERDGLIRVTTRLFKVDPGSSVAILDGLTVGDYLKLEVSDTGSGMSPEIRTRVFDPFFTTKSAGRGLGLAVVDGIVRGLGGSIRVTSERGKGTTFQILLRCTETLGGASRPTMSSTVEESPGPSGQPVILVVEDEDVLRQAVSRMLRMKGFEVLEAADGSSAIDALRAAADRIEVILLDMTLPGASSAEVVAEAARARPDVSVILTSAYSQEMLTAPFSVSQVRGFIRKPFQLADLVNTVRRATNVGHSRISQGA